MFDIDPHQLIARADALLAARERQHGVRGHRQRDVDDAREAHRFAAVLMSVRARVDDLPMLADLHTRSKRWRYGTQTSELLATALASLIERASPDDEAIVALAQSKVPRERRLVAEYLPVDTPRGRARVAPLLADRDPSVREAAAARLPDEAPPWWAAAFSRDPTPLIAPAAREVVERALHTIVLGIDDAADNPTPVYQALEQLPTPALFDAVMRVYSRPRRWITWERPLLAMVLERPGGAALVRTCLQQLEHVWILDNRAQARWLLRGSDKRRAELALSLADEVLRAPPDKISSWQAHRIAAEWPKSVDPAPLIERALAHPHRAPPDDDQLYYDTPEEMVECVVHNDHAEAWAVRLLEERLAGGYRLGAVLGRYADELIARCRPEVLRPLAERGLAVDSCLGWSVRALLGRCHDRERDPPRGVLARAWVAQPRMTEVVYEARPDLVLAWLRARVRRGQASLGEVVQLVRHGRVKDEVLWAEIRRVRADALMMPRPSAFEILQTFTVAHWGPEEWVAVDTYMTRIPAARVFLVETLCRQTSREAVPRVERLLGLLEADDREDLLKHRSKLALLHGLELGPPPPPAPEVYGDD